MKVAVHVPPPLLTASSSDVQSFTAPCYFAARGSPPASLPARRAAHTTLLRPIPVNPLYGLRLVRLHVRQIKDD